MVVYGVCFIVRHLSAKRLRKHLTRKIETVNVYADVELEKNDKKLDTQLLN